MELRLDHDYPESIRNTRIEAWQFTNGLPVPLCSICSVLPHTACYGPCGHTFCDDCKDAICRMPNAVCPLDCISMDDGNCCGASLTACIDVDEESFVKSQMYCRWTRLGQCDWKGPLQDLGAHQDKCLRCPRCGTAVMCDRLITHLLNDIQCRKYCEMQKEKEQNKSKISSDTEQKLKLESSASNMESFNRDEYETVDSKTSPSSSSTNSDHHSGRSCLYALLKKRLTEIESKMDGEVRKIRDEFETHKCDVNEEISRLTADLRELKFESKLSQL